MKVMVLSVLGFISAVSLVASVSANDVSIVGGITVYSPSGTDSDGGDVNLDSKTGFTFGALVGFDEFGVDGFGIETGLISVAKVYALGDLGIPHSISGRALEVPVLARYYPLPELSFGGGLYLQKFVGDITIEGNGNKADFTYDQFGFKTTDIGLKFNLRGAIPVAPTTHLFADFSYKHGLLNLVKDATEQNSYRSRDIDLLGGVSFGF